MKTRILIALFFAAMLACEKPTTERITNGTVTFWTTEESGPTKPNGDTGWVLWVDNLKIGPIAKLDGRIPYCQESGFTNMSLSEGRHSYKLKRTIPTQPPPNSYVGNTYYFDVTIGGCTLVRAIQ